MEGYEAFVDDAETEIHRRWGGYEDGEFVPVDGARELAEAIIGPVYRDLRGAVYVIGRLDDALRAVDDEYAGSPLEQDEVRPFLDHPRGR